MYGYVRPSRGELRIREYEDFRAAYCGLCHALGRRCGLAARFVVNYDLTFLAMALSDGSGCLSPRRCLVHPLRKRACLCRQEALDRAADYSVILAWWKLRDEVRDGSLLRRAAAGLGMLALRGAYRRSRRNAPGFDAGVRDKLAALLALEQDNCAVLDKAADCFAALLAQAAQSEPDPQRRRVLTQLFYHLGRSVYILDAIDDLPGDAAAGLYNPLRGRFGREDGRLTDSDREELRRTLSLSQSSIAGAFALLKSTRWTPVLENIIMIGLPQVTELVLSGLWKKRRQLARDHTNMHRSEEI